MYALTIVVSIMTENMHLVFFTTNLFNWLASWSSGNVFVSGARSLKFKSRPGQAMACHTCNIFSEEAVLTGRNDGEMGLANSYTLRRDTASIKKDLIVWFVMQKN